MMSNDKIESAAPHVIPALPYADNALDPIISRLGARVLLGLPKPTRGLCQRSAGETDQLGLRGRTPRQMTA